jgi:hypothetical protein
VDLEQIKINLKKYVFSSRGTVRYEERGEGYRDVEKVGKRWARESGDSEQHVVTT